MTAAKEAGQAAAGGEPGSREAAELELARQLAERARAEGPSLTGPGGLLGRLTKIVLEGALEGELDAHLGYAKHDPAGRDGWNPRNGHRAKTVLTDGGPVEIDMPRDRDSSFAPKIVAKRQRRPGWQRWRGGAPALDRELRERGQERHSTRGGQHHAGDPGAEEAALAGRGRGKGGQANGEVVHAADGPVTAALMVAQPGHDGGG